MIKKNYLGQVIIGPRQFIDPSYGYYDEFGDEHVNWRSEDETVDSDGFDKTNHEYSDSYKQDVVLPYGKLICRYGNKRGRFTTDVGTSYEKLSLPYIKETVEYHVYKVIADGLKVKCEVTKGRTAPMFNSDGGAIQYKHHHSLATAIQQKELEEVYI